MSHSGAELNYVQRVFTRKRRQTAPGSVEQERRRQRVLVGDDSPVIRDLVTEIFWTAQSPLPGRAAL